MIKQIFINLPVHDLSKSMAFFRRLGFDFNPQFTDENAASMVLGENIFVMLLTHQYFQGFTPKAISDAYHSSEVLIAIPVESREAVGAMVQKALEAGGKTYSEARDHGFMLQHGFEDLDGHIWEVFFMDMSAMHGQS